MAKLLHSLPLYACVTYNLGIRLSVPTYSECYKPDCIIVSSSGFHSASGFQPLPDPCRLRRGSLSSFESETQAKVAYFTAAISPSYNRNEVRYDLSLLLSQRRRKVPLSNQSQEKKIRASLNFSARFVSLFFFFAEA